ncbi:hypothetical protein ATCV1_z059L [Acanthocystis turfacea chlorella virus 1]|uniref:Uncharacterized protein z059L n=1 Tax=Chlorovirus heliozoae TaxID=322019 RepID=A7K819_9PHYC|nr:hypothetical protein ATCV1_z059L [Acanthocystis turfacea chlorella virus 1]ABT16193.1 hypothetical protein ATCV1_z059L [Acanthocystis turfacea chlorella virus 1]
MKIRLDLNVLVYRGASEEPVHPVLDFHKGISIPGDAVYLPTHEVFKRPIRRVNFTQGLVVKCRILYDINLQDIADISEYFALRDIAVARVCTLAERVINHCCDFPRETVVPGVFFKVAGQLCILLRHFGGRVLFARRDAE